MKYLIVANGPFLAKNIILEAIGVENEKVIIALDGAINKLAAIGVRPHIVLGDFDSVIELSDKTALLWGITETKSRLLASAASSTYEAKYGIEVIPAPSQDYTDLQKAITYCDNNQAEIIEIVCATGGRMDHHETNVRTLRKMYKPTRPIYLHTEFQTLEFVRDNTTVIKGEIGDFCGILTAPNCQFMSSDDGLAWSKNDDGTPYQLTYGDFESTSNELSKQSATIVIKGDALVVHPGHLRAQRDFSLLSESDRAKYIAKQLQFTLAETTMAEWKEFKKAYKQAKTDKNLWIIKRKVKSNHETLYVSHSKHQLTTLPDNEFILLSMTKNKLSKFMLFKHHSDNSQCRQSDFTTALHDANENGIVKFYKKS